MSSPLALAWHRDSFLGYHETKRLLSQHQLKEKLYLIYVNEVLFTFANEQKSLNYLNILNNKDPNNKFMMEKNFMILFHFWMYLSQGLTLMKSHFRNTTGLHLDF